MSDYYHRHGDMEDNSAWRFFVAFFLFILALGFVTAWYRGM